MDIATLYDAARDAGINWDNEDAVRDLQDIWAKACLTNAEFIEENISDIFFKGIDRIVAEHLYDWWADCVGYHRDMAAGRAEDAAISRAEWLKEQGDE